MSGQAETLQLKLAFARKDFGLRVNADVPLDGITAIFGPSGSGKTTLLRLIAGLEKPDTGKIMLGDEVWFDSAGKKTVPPHRRGAGNVFQDARLFEHLNVRGNLAFADKRSRGQGGAIGFDDVVDAMGLSDLLKRNVSGLSGGERRRVALARTLLTRPRLLLLDEPLVGLDRAARRDILPYLRDVPARFGVPALYVSHDIEEVTALASRMLVLKAGEVMASGPIGEVMHTLDLGPLMADGTAGSVIEAVVAGHDPAQGVTRLSLGEHTLSLPLDARLSESAAVRLFVDASDVALATVRPQGISIRNILPAQITAIVPGNGGQHVDVITACGPATLRARITRAAVEELGLSEGREVFALVKTMSFAD